MVNGDKTISPTMATHLVLGAIRKGEEVEAAVLAKNSTSINEQSGERVTVTFGADDHIDEVFYDGEDVKSQCSGLGQVRSATFTFAPKARGTALAYP